MNTLHTIYLLSTTGAAVFYAAGFLTRSLPRAKDAQSQKGAIDTQAFEAELASLRSQLEAAKSEAKQFRIALDVTENQKNTELRHVEQETQARADLEQKRAALENQLQLLQQALREAESRSQASQGELGDLRNELVRERKARQQMAAEMVESRELEDEKTIPYAAEPKEETQPFGKGLPRDQQGATVGARRGRGALVSSTLAGVGEDGKKQNLQDLRKRLELAQADASKAKETLRAAEKQLRDSRGSFRDAETRAVVLNASLAEKTDAIRKLERDLSQARAKAASLEREVGKGNEAALAASAATLAKVSDALAEERKKVRALENERSRWKEDHADRSAQNTAEIEKLRQERVELKGEIDRQDGASGEVDTLRSELHQAKMELETARRKAESAESLQDELDELKQQVALGGDVDELRRELNGSRNDNRQLRIDAQVAADRIAVLQGAADEVVTLRAQVNELENAQQENVQLKAQMRTLKSHALASGGSERPPAPPARGNAATNPRIDDALSEVLAVETMRSAVVADTMGLLVSGVGDAAYHEGMGAMAGVIKEVVQRAHDLLPLGGLRSIHLADANNLVVSCGLARWMQEDVVLVTLSSGMPTSDVIDATLNSIASSSTDQEPSTGSAT